MKVSNLRPVGASAPTERRLAERLLAYRRRCLLALVALLSCGFCAIGIGKVTLETGITSFLPSSDPSLERFEHLASSFGGDPIVVLLEARKPRPLLDQQQLRMVFALEGELARLDGVAAVYGPASTLNQIAGQAQLLLAELTGRRDGIRAAAQARAKHAGASTEEAAEAADRAVDGFDRRYGPLIVDGLPTGLPTLRNPRFVERVLYNEAHQARPQWKYLVPRENSLAILVRPDAGLNQTSTEQLVDAVRNAAARSGLDMMRATVSGVPALVADVGRQVDREVPLLGGIAVAGVGLCLLCVPWTNSRRRRLLPLGVTVAATALTVAAMGWLDRPVSLGVLAFLPVLVGLGGYYPTYFARRARSGVVFLVAAATAAGFTTLLWSPLPSVRDLGVTLAVGVGFAVALGWVFIGRTASAISSPQSAEPVVSDAGVSRSMPRRRRLVVLAIAGIVAAGGWVLLPLLPLETDIQDLTHGLSATEDAERVESIAGSSGELDLVIEGSDVLTPEAWKWMRSAQETIIRQHGDEMDPVLSPTTLTGFLGGSPSRDQIRAAIRLLPPYLTTAVVRGDGRVAVQSYGVVLDDLGNLRSLLDKVRTELPAAPPGYETRITGLPTVAIAGYQLVSGHRYLTNMAGIVAAALVLFTGLRGRRSDAARAVAAAFLATGVALALLWLTDTALNPFTAALGSLTAAVGCEFTIMFAESIRRRDRTLRQAVLLAALTSGIGYVVLAVSELAALRQFGLLLAGSVVLSYVASCLVVWSWPPSASQPRSHHDATRSEAISMGVS